MLATASVFDVIAADETDQRVASRRALALAQSRVDHYLGDFLRGAVTESDFNSRLAAVKSEFDGYVQSACNEYGHIHPEFISSTLVDHYASNRRWQPRTADDHWIEKAVKKPGELHKDLGVPEGKKIPEKKLEEAEHSDSKKVRERAQFAENVKKGSPIDPRALDYIQRMQDAREMSQGQGRQGADWRVMGPPDPNASSLTGDDAFDLGFGMTPEEYGQESQRVTDPAERERLLRQNICPDCNYNVEHCHCDPYGENEHGSNPGFPSGHMAGKQGSPLGRSSAPRYPEPDPLDEHWDIDRPVFMDPTAFGVDPIRNQQGYIRRGVPKDVARDEGYETMPQWVDPELAPGVVGGSPMELPPDSGLSIGPTLPPVWPGRKAPIHQGAEENPSSQKDLGDHDVSCPECGGSGKTANQSKCGKCYGKGRVPNFGDSVLDHVAMVLLSEDQGNTGLGEAEPKMDKRKWEPGNLDQRPEEESSGRWPTKSKDIIEPIMAENRDQSGHELSEIGEGTTEHVSLPSASDNDTGFYDGGEIKGPSDWQGGNSQVDPVTSAAKTECELCSDRVDKSSTRVVDGLRLCPDCRGHDTPDQAQVSDLERENRQSARIHATQN